MPEGPEVLIIAEILNKELIGKKIVNSTIDSMKKFLPLNVYKITSKGKKILFLLDNQLGEKIVIISSLGMTGFWFFDEHKHTREVFEFEDKKLYYDDIRNFGSIKVCSSINEYRDAMKDVGLCLMKERSFITEGFMLQTFKNKRLMSKPVGEFLLEQKRFSGIGNYLKSEILYEAEIDPRRILSTLSDIDILRIRSEIFKVMDNSYESGGFSMKDYKNPYGNKGNFVPKIYGKNIDPDGFMIEKIESDRSTFWVPNIQK